MGRGRGRAGEQGGRSATRRVRGGSRPAGGADVFTTGGTAGPAWLAVKALEITDLRKRYANGVEALGGVSIAIEPGDFYGLLGPNGAGKSTLIHCTTGLAQPTGGEIRVFGHDAIADYSRGAPGGRPRAAGGQPRPLPHRRGDARLPRRLFRDAQARAPRPHRGAARDLLADRQSPRPDPHALGRDETAADPRPRADAPAAPADPRRADRRRRHRAAARALALRPQNQRRRDDDPAHHPLPRGGRPALQPDRLHRRRPDRRRGHQRGPRRALRSRQPRGRLPAAGRPRRAVALAGRGRRWSL